jgi:S-adenosylmethionine decarboxylase
VRYITCKSGHFVSKDIFYSRKNFLHPELQPDPHRSFSKEVQVLDEVFDNGAAYCLGQMNGDCWYLYTLNRPIGLAGLNRDDGYVSASDTPPARPAAGGGAPDAEQQLSLVPIVDVQRANEADQTLEVLMMDLDPEVMKIFTKAQCSTAYEARVVIPSLKEKSI